MPWPRPAHSAEKYLLYHSTLKRPCGQLIVVDDGYDLFLTLVLYPSLAWEEQAYHLEGDPEGRTFGEILVDVVAAEVIEPWVAGHVIPYLRHVPPGIDHELDRVEAADLVATYLAGDSDPVIIADWPEDLAVVLVRQELVWGKGPALPDLVLERWREFSGRGPAYSEETAP